MVDGVYMLPCCDDSACLALSCRVVLWVVEWRWCDGCVVLVACLPLLPVLFLSSFLPLFLFVLVFGVVRAQPLRARTLSPNTIVSLVCFVSSSSSSASPFFTVRLSIVRNGGG